MANLLLWAGMAAAALGIGALRWSWSLKGRSHSANLAGWALLVAGCVCGGIAAGAWGAAIVSLVAMGIALAVLSWAAATSPSRPGRSPGRRVRLLPDGDGPLRMGGRLATFALVVVAGFAASVALAIALRAGAIGLGWSEADANAAALFVVPIAWGALATLVLMLETRRAQFVALLAASLPLAPALMAGG